MKYFSGLLCFGVLFTQLAIAAQDPKRSDVHLEVSKKEFTLNPPECLYIHGIPLYLPAANYKFYISEDPSVASLEVGSNEISPGLKLVLVDLQRLSKTFVKRQIINYSKQKKSAIEFEARSANGAKIIYYCSTPEDGSKNSDIGCNFFGDEFQISFQASFEAMDRSAAAKIFKQKISICKQSKVDDAIDLISLLKPAKTGD